MRKLLTAALLVGVLAFACPLAAQQVCPGFSIVVDTPEDQLMLAVNGAETPQEQIAALEKFTQEFPDSKFMPCVHEYFTMAYMKLNDYAKVIEHGEKGLSGEHKDVMLMLNTVKAYVASNQVSDGAFEIIRGALPVIRTENTPSRPANISDEEYKEIADQAEAQAKDQRGYMEYAFFQLLQREADANKRIQWLSGFVEAYPESTNAAQIDFNFYLAYKMAGDAAKSAEYGEQAIASDPNNVVTLNLVADDYATRQTDLDKAETYATKALDLAPSLAKPAGMADEQFTAYQNQQMGMARLSLGYVAFQRGAKTRRYLPAIDQFKLAVDLLEANPALQGRALFYLGYAYEASVPPNRKGAIEALTRAASLPSPWQAQAQDILAKIKAAAGTR